MQTKVEVLEACRAFQVERVGMFRRIVAATLDLGFRQSQIAACMGVEESSVHRWVHELRSPRRRSQAALIERLTVWLAQAEIPPRSPQADARFMPKEERVEHFRRTLEQVGKEIARGQD